MATEFPFHVRFAGLRPEKQSTFIGGEFCEVLQNMKPSEDGLIAFDDVSNPLDITPTINWPNPQLFRGEGVTILALDTAIYSVDETTTPWTTTVLAGISPFAGGPWQFASFQESWFLTNGVSFIYKIPSNASDNVLLIDGITIQAIGSFGARMFMGGLAGNYFSNSAVWARILTAWKSFSADTVISYDDQALTTNWLFWSAPGGGDKDWPFVMMLAALGAPNPSEVDKIIEALIAKIEEGSVGMMPLRSQGSISAIKQLGDLLIVYCTDSISILKASGLGYISKNIRIGIASRGAVAGDDEQHIFVDSSGILYSVTDDRGIQKLGYVNSIGALTLANINMAFDSIDNDYYISDGTTCYVLSNNGLSQRTSIPTTLDRNADGLIGPIATATTTMFLRTEPIVMNVPDLKAVKVVELTYENLTSATVAFSIRYQHSGSYIALDFVPGSPEGIFFPRAAGTSFKLRITGTITSSAKIKSANLRFQYASNRSVRGPRSSPAGSRVSSDETTV